MDSRPFGSFCWSASSPSAWIVMTQETASTKQTQKSPKTLTVIGILLLAVGLAYFNCLQNEFIWDDEFLIEKNSYLRSFSNLPKMLVSNSTAGFGGVDNFYRPTQNIYYLLIFQMFGYNKVAFHMGNLLLHFLNSLLLFFVLTRLFKNRPLAFVSSLLWAVHPTHVEAIGYISGTADPMGLLFFLLCLLYFPFNKEEESFKSICLSTLFFSLSLISKEAMIVVPPLLMVTVAINRKPEMFHPKTYVTTLPSWVIAFSYLLIRKYWLNFNETYSFYKVSNIYTENMLFRAFTYLATLPEYLTILFWPTDLHMERSFPVFIEFTLPPVLMGFTALMLSFAVSAYLFIRKDQKMALWAWLWFFVAFVPMMGILIPVNSFILEHWLYLPSIGLFVVMASLLLKMQNFHPLLMKGTTALICITLIVLTHYRNKDWRTPISFYSNILKYSEGSARVHNNLAMAYSAEKNWPLAIQHYQKAISLSDIYPQTHYNLARAYIQNNDLVKAQLHLQRSLEIKPDFIFAIELQKQLQDFIRKNRQPASR
jgi:tetratricopeptide (TPR) repeat protein